MLELILFIVGVVSGFLLWFSVMFHTSGNGHDRSQREMLFSFFTGLTVHILLAIFVYTFFGSDIPCLNSAKLAGLVLCMPLILFFFRGRLFQAAFLLGMSAMIAIVAHSLGNTLEISLQLYDIRYGRAINVFSATVMTAILLLAILGTLKRLAVLWNAVDDNLLWSRIWPLPLLSSFLVLLSGNIWITDSILTLSFFLSRVLAVAVLYFTLYLLRYISEQLRDKWQYEQNAVMAQRGVQLQKELYEQITRRMEDHNRSVHDLRHHIAVLQQYAEKGDSGEIRGYLERYSRSVIEEKQLIFCENPPVNAILYHYHQMAREERIETDISVDIRHIPENVETDLCVLIGNIFENAIQAVARLPDTGRRIVLHAAAQKDTFSLYCENPYNSPIRKSKGRFLSASHEGFGQGTASVELIAEKYGGTVRYQTEQNCFVVSVLLYLRGPAGEGCEQDATTVPDR